MEFCKWKASNIQWFSLWAKIFKNLILTLPTKYYPVLLCSRYDNLKLHEVDFLPVGSFRFYKVFTENVKFPYLVVQIEVRIAKNMQGTRKNNFLFPNYNLSWKRNY